MRRNYLVCFKQLILEENQMNKRLITVFGLLMIASMLLAACTPAAATATTVPTATSAPANIGGWLENVVFTAIADAPSAVAQLQAGAIDMYPVTVSDPNVFSTVKGDATLAYSNTYGSNDQLLFNTVDCTSL